MAWFSLTPVQVLEDGRGQSLKWAHLAHDGIRLTGEAVYDRTFVRIGADKDDHRNVRVPGFGETQ